MGVDFKRVGRKVGGNVSFLFSTEKFSAVESAGRLFRKDNHGWSFGKRRNAASNLKLHFALSMIF